MSKAKISVILFLIFFLALFLYSFYLFSINGDGGIPFIILMMSSTIFFGSLRLSKLKNEYLS